jgi:hypothetical protein
VRRAADDRLFPVAILVDLDDTLVVDDAAVVEALRAVCAEAAGNAGDELLRTACANTRFLSYEEVSEWQSRLIHDLSDPEEGWQGITALTEATEWAGRGAVPAG